MLVVSSSPIDESLTMQIGIKPWRLPGGSRAGPVAFEALVGGSECALPVHGAGRFRRDSVPATAKRIRKFGGGCYSFVRFKRYVRVVEHRNGNGNKLRLERCEPSEGETILLGYFCGPKRENEYEVTPVGAEVLIEKQATVDGFYLVAFVARLEAESGYVLVGRKDGGGSHVDVYSADGRERLNRKELINHNA